MPKLTQEKMIRLRAHRPPAQRAWQPKPAEPGQPVTWTRVTPGRWTIPATEWRETPGGTWIPPVTTAMTGVIWSAGPQANSVWARCADGTIVALKMPAASRRDEPQEMHAYCATWQRDTLRRVEHVRHSAGIFAEDEPRTRYEYGRGNVTSHHTVAYHCDRDCPAISHETRELYDWEPRAGYVVRMLLDATGNGRSDLCRTCIYLAAPVEVRESAAA